MTDRTVTDRTVARRLVRPRDNRVIAGVCSGLSRRFGVNPTLVRVVFLLSLLLPGPQVLIYLALWIIMPREGAGSSSPYTSGSGY
jgi:phage shock protein PspC (stress-responsive transcriptional regulator)